MAANLSGDGNVYNPLTTSIPSGLSPDQFNEIQEQAIEYSSDARFHRSFLLSPNPTIGRDKTLRVAYSDAGFSQSDASEDEEIPVLLWCGGMFGGRYQAVADDKEAKRQRIRFIAVDKPGIGGTEEVPLERRIATWLDIVPALLKHLGIKHVSLAAHSNGTIYVLNTLLHQRELLHPDRPYVALFAPWVLPAKSGKYHLQLMQSLPAPVLGTWHYLARFVNNNVGPMITVTRNAWNPVSRIVKLVPSSAKQIDSTITNTDVGLQTRAYLAVLQSLLTKYIFLEQIHGASQEVLLCLQKGQNLWGDWSEYAELVPRVAANETTHWLDASTTTSEARRKLKIQCFFASADELVGTKGQAWLESCWAPEKRGNGIDFESEAVPDTDHNSLLPVERGALSKVLRYVSNSPVEGLAATPGT